MAINIPPCLPRYFPQESAHPPSIEHQLFNAWALQFQSLLIQSPKDSSWVLYFCAKDRTEQEIDKAYKKFEAFLQKRSLTEQRLLTADKFTVNKHIEIRDKSFYCTFVIKRQEPSQAEKAAQAKEKALDRFQSNLKNYLEWTQKASPSLPAWTIQVVKPPCETASTEEVKKIINTFCTSLNAQGFSTTLHENGWDTHAVIDIETSH